jgi:hypothetical protein
MTAAPFISWIGHGAASLAPAGVFTGVTSHAFAFRSNKDAMQGLADKFLNAAAGGKVKYVAPVGLAMVSFIDCLRCTSSIDRIGWVPGRETALWVPLLEFSGLHMRPVLWSPYIYIDYTIGMLTGREVWGWSKVLGRIDVPDPSSSSPPTFTCSTTTFSPMAPETGGVFGPLYQVVGAASQPARPAPVPDAADGFTQFMAKLFEDAEGGAAAAGLTLSAVALKQFRDSLDPGLACYQAICDSPVQVTRPGPIGFLDGAGFTLEITTCDSHRIVQDFLGRAPDPGKTVLPIAWGMWAELDFQALPGRVIAP